VIGLVVSRKMHFNARHSIHCGPEKRTIFEGSRILEIVLCVVDPVREVDVFCSTTILRG